MEQAINTENLLEFCLLPWSVISEEDVTPFHRVTAGRIANILIEGRRYQVFDSFLSTLPDRILELFLEREDFRRALIKLRCLQERFDEVCDLIKDGTFCDGSDLVEVWDHAQYELKGGGCNKLSSLQRFRIRRRNPPPASICPEERPKRNLGSSATAVLETWLEQNSHCPYPSKAARDRLAQESGLSQSQIKTWFANARRRRIKCKGNTPKEQEKRKRTVKTEKKARTSRRKIDGAFSRQRGDDGGAVSIEKLVGASTENCSAENSKEFMTPQAIGITMNKTAPDSSPLKSLMQMCQNLAPHPNQSSFATSMTRNSSSQTSSSTSSFNPVSSFATATSIAHSSSFASSATPSSSFVSSSFSSTSFPTTPRLNDPSQQQQSLAALLATPAENTQLTLKTSRVYSLSKNSSGRNRSEPLRAQLLPGEQSTTMTAPPEQHSVTSPGVRSTIMVSHQQHTETSSRGPDSVVSLQEQNTMTSCQNQNATPASARRQPGGVSRQKSQKMASSKASKKAPNILSKLTDDNANRTQNPVVAWHSQTCSETTRSFSTVEYQVVHPPFPSCTPTLHTLSPPWLPPESPHLYTPLDLSLSAVATVTEPGSRQREENGSEKGAGGLSPEMVDPFSPTAPSAQLRGGRREAKWVNTASRGSASSFLGSPTYASSSHAEGQDSDLAVPGADILHSPPHTMTQMTVPSLSSPPYTLLPSFCFASSPPYASPDRTLGPLFLFYPELCTEPTPTFSHPVNTATTHHDDSDSCILSSTCAVLSSSVEETGNFSTSTTNDNVALSSGMMDTPLRQDEEDAAQVLLNLATSRQSSETRQS